MLPARRKCWRGWKPLTPESSWEGQQGGQACQCQRTSQACLVLRRKGGTAHPLYLRHHRRQMWLLSVCQAGNPETLAQEENAATPQAADQETLTETPSKEENSTALQFIEQESQTEALAPGAAVKPFCKWCLRRGLGRPLAHRVATG